jgi:hypothetical protein
MHKKLYILFKSVREKILSVIVLIDCIRDIVINEIILNGFAVLGV